jgi:hypothetical protein
MGSNADSLFPDDESRLYDKIPLPMVEGSNFIHVLHLHHGSKDAPLAGTLEAGDLSIDANPVHSTWTISSAVVAVAMYLADSRTQNACIV